MQCQGARWSGWHVAVELYPADVRWHLPLVASLRDVGVSLPDEHRLVPVRRTVLRARLRVVAIPKHRAKHHGAREAGVAQSLQKQRRVGPRW